MAQKPPLRPGASGNPHGRPRGSRNKRSLANIEAAQSGGQLPLDFLLSVMRDSKQSIERRLEAAKAAAPYLHSKLAAIENPGPQDDKSRVTGIRVEFFVPKRRADDDEPPPRFRKRTPRRWRERAAQCLLQSLLRSLLGVKRTLQRICPLLTQSGHQELVRAQIARRSEMA
jgi:hypothetical protein